MTIDFLEFDKFLKVFFSSVMLKFSPCLMASNISLTLMSRCQKIKKATENFGFQIARFANRLRSATK